MPNFHNLQNILEMDFTQLRALRYADGRDCASDAAISLFVDNLTDFFAQFAKPATPAELKEYLAYMNEITFQINISEYAYSYYDYQFNYPNHTQEELETMAQLNKLDSFKSIPTRMQYWAAAEEWAGPVRNAQKHISVVKNLDKWAKLVEKNLIAANKQRNDANSFFPAPTPASANTLAANSQSIPSPNSASQSRH